MEWQLFIQKYAYPSTSHSLTKKSEIRDWIYIIIIIEIQRTIFSFEALWNSIFSPNRAVSFPTLHDYYRQAAAICAKHTQGTQSKLEFDTLAVDPAYQRHGYGEKLIEWCGMRAWEEDIVVFGDTSPQVLPLYVRNGCEEIGWIMMPEKIIEAADKCSSNIILDRIEVIVLKWKA
jgi:GNAT superfamily N-acetyltransferase